MNSFIPYGVGNNSNMGLMNVPQINPYQQKLERYEALQQNNTQNNPTTNMNFIVVENIQKAKEQIVPCGYTMWMRDSNEPYQYVKSVDQVGTSIFKILKVEDVTEQFDSNNQLDNSFEQFVSIEDYNNLTNKVNELQSSVNYCNDVLRQAIESASSKNNNKEDKIVDAEYKDVKKRGLLGNKYEKVGDA